jgi:hypothetical protein
MGISSITEARHAPFAFAVDAKLPGSPCEVPSGRLCGLVDNPDLSFKLNGKGTIR